MRCRSADRMLHWQIRMAKTKRCPKQVRPLSATTEQNTKPAGGGVTTNTLKAGLLSNKMGDRKGYCQQQRLVDQLDRQADPSHPDNCARIRSFFGLASVRATISFFKPGLAIAMPSKVRPTQGKIGIK